MKISILRINVQSIALLFLTVGFSLPVRLQGATTTIRYQGYITTEWIRIGVVFQSTTLSSAISLVQGNPGTPVSLVGTEVIKRDNANNNWFADSYTFGWEHDLSIDAGDVIWVKIPSNGVDVNVTGTFYSGSKLITVYPGWNMLAANVTDDLSNTGIFSPLNGDQVQAFRAPDNSWDSGDFFMYDFGAWDPSEPYVYFGGTFWYYSASGSNRTWTESF